MVENFLDVSLTSFYFSRIKDIFEVTFVIK